MGRSVEIHLWVLRRVKYLGNKVIVTLLSDTQGLIVAIALAHRKQQPLLPGQLFTAQLKQTHAASMHKLSDSELAWLQPLSPRAQAGLHHMNHFLLQTLAAEQPVPDIFVCYNDLIGALAEASGSMAVRATCLGFQTTCLTHLGLWPDLSVDYHDEPLQTDSVYEFFDRQLQPTAKRSNLSPNPRSYFVASGSVWQAVYEKDYSTVESQKLSYALIQDCLRHSLDL